MRSLLADLASSRSPLTVSRISALVAVLGLAAAPLTLHLPLWIILFCLLLGLWRMVAARGAWPLPGKALRFVFAVAALVGIYLTFGTIVGRDAGVALLVIVLGEKLLETQYQRDCMVLVFLGYFLVITNFLYSQSIVISLYMLAVIVLLTAMLVDLSRGPKGRSVYVNLRTAGALFLQALPFMLVLFVLFPRLGPLWALPETGRGSMGLTEDMSPGSVGRLARSPAVAFRATFEGAIPPPGDRYWRGPVFWHTDGHTWSRGLPPAALPAQAIEGLGSPLRYTVTLEPHDRAWVFALDLPTTTPAGTYITSDFQVLANTAIHGRARYRLTSHSNYRTATASSGELRQALELPEKINPRTRALALSWRAAVGSDAQLVRMALDHFRKLAFVYTLTPPFLGSQASDHTVDNFLFDSRRGFCEHYAAAFTTLMRVAGVPARVVTGYQGGEINPLGRYMVVRQSDAHAWAEVYLAGPGWMRIDPTAAVAPERIAQGSDAVMGEESGPGLFNLESGWLGQSLRGMRQSWDAVNFAWTQWVLGYNTERQMRLLERFGLGDWAWPALISALVFGLCFILVVLGAYVLLERPTKRDPVLKAYMHFCAKLARLGLVRAPTEGPQDFAARAVQRHPELGEHIKLITRLYCALRYSPSHSRDAAIQLQRHVRRFRT